MNNNGAFRKKKVYFSQVSNEPLRDNTLSLKAKGLYALIQSYITIENFILYKNTLKKDCQEGKLSFETTWKELKDKGYLVQYKLRNEKGGFYYEYELLDESQVPKTEGVGFLGVENRDTGKVGIYNKTDLNNTNSNNTYCISSSEEAEVLEVYKNSKGKVVSPAEKKKLKIFIETYTTDLVLKAIEETVMKATQFNLAYVKSCLEDWVDLEGYKKSKSAKKGSYASNKATKDSNFNNFKNRDYDFDDLEKKLLGWDKEDM